MTTNLMKQYKVELAKEMQMWDEIEASAPKLPKMTFAEYESLLSIDPKQLSYDVELWEGDEVNYILDKVQRKVWLTTYANIIHPHLKSIKKILLCYSEKDGIQLNFIENPDDEWLVCSGADITDINTYGISAERFSIDISELFNYANHQQDFIDTILDAFLNTTIDRLSYEDFEMFLKRF